MFTKGFSIFLFSQTQLSIRRLNNMQNYFLIIVIFIVTLNVSGLEPFWHQGPVLWKTIFPWPRDVGGCFRMILTRSEQPRSLYVWFTVGFELLQFHSVQSLSRVQLFATPWTAARQASLFITNSQSLLKLMSIKSVMPSNHLILCHPLLLLPSTFTSIRVFFK